VRIKSLKIPQQPEKAQTFLWEPIEGFNIEPKFGKKNPEKD
jgi:hypothetical protein